MELYFLCHLLHHKRCKNFISCIYKKKYDLQFLRNVTVIVSNTDSLMAADQMNLIRRKLTRESFDNKFATYRENFKTNLESKINRYLLDNSEDDRTGDATGDDIELLGAGNYEDVILPEIYHLGTVVSVILPTMRRSRYLQYSS